jgi:hypothetical protein
MRLMLSLMICLGLSACATDYVSQMSEANYGVRSLEFTKDDVDPIPLMNGTSASKRMNGLYVSRPQQSSSGWNP